MFTKRFQRVRDARPILWVIAIVMLVAILLVSWNPLITLERSPIMVDPPQEQVFLLIMNAAPPSEIRAELTAHPEHIHSIDFMGYSVLGCAVHYQRRDVVKTLLAMGADPNGETEQARTGKLRYTPLFIAILRKDPLLVQMLLDAGADPSFALPGQPSARDFAAIFRYDEIRELIDNHHLDDGTHKPIVERNGVEGH